MKHKHHNQRLHVYGANSQHDTVAITGDTESLTALRNAINHVLANPTATARTDNYAADGEGFVAVVRCLTDKQWAGIPLPYAHNLDHDEQSWANLNNLLSAK